MTYQTTARWGEPVDPQTYQEVGDAVDKFYSHDQFQEAYDLMEKTWPGLPDGALHPSKQDCVQFKVYLLAQLHCGKEALAAAQSMLRSGYTSRLTWDGFDVIRDLDGYEAFEQENNELLAKEKSAAERELEVALPESFDPSQQHPLCILLHGDGGSMAKFREHWTAEPLLKRGFIVAFVQSSQLVFTNRYAWLPEPDTAWGDIGTVYKDLCEQYSIDSSSILLGGFSGGAITAVDLVFGEAVPATGFICLCPEYKPAHFTSDAVAAAKARGVRGVFLEGDIVWPLDQEAEMMDVMKAGGFPIQLILNKDLGHAFPEDFEGKLEQALRFVLNE